ncbi:MAG: DUF2793 domain-containing protein [Pseudomonadota bacterium]
MSDTLNFKMPLLDAAQAQKHVTVNEALVRADALGAGIVQQRGLTAPPLAPADETVWIVGTSATDAWQGRDDQVALFLNGGWIFVQPWFGQTFWELATGRRLTWTGGSWDNGVLSVSANAAMTVQRVAEIDHALAAGAVSTTAPIIPDKAIVAGVTARVTAEITGASGWSLGVAGAPDRYGSGYGVEIGAFAHGVSAQPQAYYGGSAIEITAVGPDFTGGSIRLAVHYQEIAPPSL